IARGSKADAIAACDTVVAQGGTAEDMWAAAAARVERAEVPTMDDLIRADVLANAAVRMAPEEPWGDLTRLDIARRWGDPVLVERRLQELGRAAPRHPRTAAALAGAQPSTSWTRAVTAWALALLIAATLARMLWHRLRPFRGRATAAALAALIA